MTDQWTQSTGIKESEAAAVARVAAIPQFFVTDNERTADRLALPPGWTSEDLATPDFTAPERQKGTFTTRTAAGFLAMIDKLESPDTLIPRITADRNGATAIINPGNEDEPSYEDLKVVYSPQRSAELNEWISASKAHKLDLWATFIADHAADIDAAAEASTTARTSVDVLTDARTWNVTARRATRRIATEIGELEDVEEFKAEVVGDALASFHILIPVLEFAYPQILTVALTRDLEQMTIAPRIPGIDRVVADDILEGLRVIEADRGELIR